MKIETALLTFLKSQPFVLYVAIFSVLWLSPNTYFVYHSFSVFISPWREIASAGVALIVASGIMIYTIRGNNKVASYYCWFEISISAYYYIDTIGWDWGLIPAMSFCLMLPISVKYYTKELMGEIIVSDQEINHQQASDDSIINQLYSNLQYSYDILKKDLHFLQSEHKQLHEDIEQERIIFHEKIDHQEAHINEQIAKFNYEKRKWHEDNFPEKYAKDIAENLSEITVPMKEILSDGNVAIEKDDQRIDDINNYNKETATAKVDENSADIHANDIYSAFFKNKPADTPRDSWDDSNPL